MWQRTARWKAPGSTQSACSVCPDDWSVHQDAIYKTPKGQRRNNNTTTLSVTLRSGMLRAFYTESSLLREHCSSPNKCTHIQHSANGLKCSVGKNEKAAGTFCVNINKTRCRISKTQTPQAPLTSPGQDMKTGCTFPAIGWWKKIIIWIAVRETRTTRWNFEKRW